MRILAAAALAVSLALPTAVLGAEKVKTNQVTKDKLGQLVQIEGAAGSFRGSKGERSPNSFFLKDDAGEIRVVIWPDVFSKIQNSKALEANGTKVSLEGEVAEYREKIELHVQDADLFKVQGGGAADTATTATATGTSPTTATR